MPAASLVLGAIGAVWLARQVAKDGGSGAGIFVAAWLGFAAGSALGLLAKCAMS
jgi:hypothetical protein